MAKAYDYSEQFEAWWQAFPKVRRKNKPGAWKVWQRDELEDIAATILADTEVRAKQDLQWLDGFVPMPTTYLNGQGWEDSWERKAPKGERPGAAPREPEPPPPQADTWKGRVNTFLLQQLMRIRGQMTPVDFERHILAERDRFAEQMRAAYGERVSRAELAEYREIVDAWKVDMARRFDKYRTTSAEGAWQSLADQAA